MSAPDPKAGSVYIWLVTCLLFVCVAAGGGFLLYYMIMPVTETSAYYPIIGVALVCLPWSFWFITALYRIFSRVLGFSIGDRDANGGNVGKNKTGGNNVQKSESINRKKSKDVSSHGGSFQRHVGLGGEPGAEGQNKGQEHKETIESTSSSVNDASQKSHESEAPLKLSMAS